MSPLDPNTLESDTPRTLDGRAYPDHLRLYEQFDADFLALVAKLEPTTFDDLSLEVDDPRARASLPRWLASAEWRGLVERRDPSMNGPRSYVLGSRGRTQLAA